VTASFKTYVTGPTDTETTVNTNPVIESISGERVADDQLKWTVLVSDDDPFDTLVAAWEYMDPESGAQRTFDESTYTGDNSSSRSDVGVGLISTIMRGYQDSDAGMLRVTVCETNYSGHTGSCAHGQDGSTSVDLELVAGAYQQPVICEEGSCGGDNGTSVGDNSTSVGDNSTSVGDNSTSVGDGDQDSGSSSRQMGGAIQGTPLSLSAAVTTFAGTVDTSGTTDGTGTGAKFNQPRGIVTDGTNLYLADKGSHTIRKVVISSGAVTTLAGSGVAGSTDGTGAAARFNGPWSLTTDGTNLYVADYSNHTIRKIVISSRVVTTLAGVAGSSGSVDGTGTSAKFNNPNDVTTDGTNLYVADRGNDTIRKVVISSGVVTTLAGTAGTSGTTDGTGAYARFDNPYGITTDGTNLYVTDYSKNTIRKVVISSGEVTTMVGMAGTPGSTDGTGTNARLDGPTQLTTDGTHLYVGEAGNKKIRKVVISTGVVTTLAGSGTSGSADGTGTSASFNNPNGVTTDGTHLYLTATGSHTIRKIE